MKNFLNLNQLSMSWNEKQKPQRFRRYAVMLMMLLTLGVGQMWASHGFFGDNACGVKVNYSGSTINEIKKNSSGASTEALGTISKLYLKEWWFAAWENTDDFSGSESGTMYYRIYPSGSASGSYTSSSRNYYNWGGWSGGSQNVWLGNNSLNVDLYGSKAPGNYIMEYYFMMGSSYLSNGSNNYKISFTVPGFTTTSKSHTFANTTVSSTKDETISFTQHYGTALTTSNCALTGTNKSEFEVRSISETGVTVRFKPSSNGSKSATLTITDAHSKTCTITLSGTTRRVVSYQKGDYGTGSTITDYKVYGTNLTLRNSGDFSRTGYNHTAWNTNSAGTGGTSYSLGGSYSSEAAVTLYPTWTPKTTSITIDLNGGSAGDESVTATYDSGLPSFTLATKTGGYNLTGYWTDDEDGDKIINSDGTLVRNTSYTSDEATPVWKSTSSSLKLYAQWNNFLSVTYDGNENTGGSAPTDATEYASGDEVTVASAPVGMVKTGYSFAGWNTAPGGGGTSYAAGATFNISANTTLYAQWTENKTAVTISASPAGTGTFTVNSVSGTSASVGVTTTAAVVATAATDFEFTSWTATNCSASPTNNKSTTLTGNGSSATGTLTATFTENVASGWYLIGDDFGGQWNTSSRGYPLNKKYRGMEGVFYRQASVNKDKYHCIHNGTYLYKPSSNTYFGGSGWGNKITLNSTSANANVRFSAAGTYYIVVDTRGTWPIIWYETSEPDRFGYHSVNVSGVENAKGTCKVTLGSTSGFETTRFANGETFYVTITGVSGYIPTITIGGTPKTWWKEQATYSASATMSTSDIAVTISYTPTRAVTFATTTGCNSLSATGPSSTAVTTGTQVKDGTVIRFAQTNSTGYTFSKWYSNTTGTSGTEYSTSSSAYDLTISSSAYTIYPLYTENMTTVNLVASPTGKGSFTIGGEAATSTTVGVTTTRSVTAVPGTGYKLSGTIWSKDNSNITLSTTTSSPVTVTGCGTSGTSSTLTGTFTPITYTIHFNGNGNTSGSMSNQTGVTYDAATTITANAFGKTGYNFAGWATTQERANAGTVDRADGAAHGNLASTQGATAQLWAVWTGKQCTLTLDQQTSATGYGSSGTVSVGSKATYDAAMPSLTGTMPTAAAGYAFMGFYSGVGGSGTKYYNADGTSANNWEEDTESTTTLYAYYKKAEITALTLDAATVVSNGTVYVKPTIDPTPTGTTKLSWYILYANGNKLASQPTISGPTDGKYSFRAPEASGMYIIAASLRTGTGSHPYYGGTLLDSTTVNFQVAGMHTVTVRYKCEGEDIKAATALDGIQPLDWSEEITAPDIIGYSFTGWSAGDGVSLTDDNGTTTKTSTTEADIKIKAIYDGYLTANYSKKRVIYFNNTLGWEDVWVYFYTSNKYWANNYGTGAWRGQYFTDSRPYYDMHRGHMTQIEGTNIWYFDYTAKGWDGWENVAFTNMGDQTGQGASADDQAPDNDHAYFSNTTANPIQVVRRGDHNTTLPMFVPLTGQTGTLLNSNKAKYVNQGYWMNYPENTGYTLKIYNKVSGDPAPVELKSIPFEFTADKTMPMELNVDLEAGQTYGFKIWRNDGLNTGAGSYYGNDGTMTANSEGWDMKTGKANCGLRTTAAGNYKFVLNFYEISSNYHYRVSVTYPVAVGDYRIVYTDGATWSGSAHGVSWNHPSGVIAKNSSATETKKDTVSFFWSYGSSPAIKFQNCTTLVAGSAKWNAGTAINVSGYSSVLTKTGVYNFIFEQPAGGASISLIKVEPYTGNYYIRTDVANSKWDNYRTDPDHVMTYSDYSIDHGGYSHYYCHWVQTDDRKNMKFVIANDYSPCISDTLIREDNTVSGWENINNYIESNGDIKRNANVRYMWNQSTNVISRAYIDGAQEKVSYFLEILSSDDKIRDPNDHEVLNQISFNDIENWVYEQNIQAQPEAAIKLLSNWGTSNTITQYFRGASDATEQLIGGSGTAWYDIRVIYDFKTNRLIASYIPVDENITTEKAIEADIMFIREHQGDIAQLTFGENGKITKIETAYGVMRFNKWTLNNLSKTYPHNPLSSPASIYERSLFYISFPFRVKLSDVIGFGTYGVHWAVQRYDGAARAQKGHFQENGSFWRWMNRNTEYLEPNQGYLLAIDLDLLGRYSDIWGPTDGGGLERRSERLEIYFPSYGTMPDITNASVTCSIPEHPCTINWYEEGKVPGPDTGDPRTSYNRTIFDSHWNVMSVPTYVNTNAIAFANTSWVTTFGGPNFLYTWNANDNTIAATSATGFEYHAMHSYMVQYGGNVTWTARSGSPAGIVASKTYAEQPSKVEFRLELQQDSAMIDRTYVALSDDEETSAGFRFGEDLTKEFNANKANIYTFIADEATAAGNTLPMSDQTTIVPVGVDIKTNGDYTFAIPDGTSGIGVTLIDTENNIRTSLSALSYTVNLTAGTHDGRFLLEIAPIQQTPTDIDLINGENGENGVRKMLIDQQMYIIRDGKIYDARGARVQ